jgi:translocation and assembly module TamB
VRVDHGAIAYIDLPSALSDINGSLIFNQDRLQIETLTAHTGGGLVTFGGYATNRGGKLSYDLTVQGQDVRLRYPPGISSTANADLHFAGSSAGSTDREHHGDEAGDDLASTCAIWIAPASRFRLPIVC